MAQFSRSAQPPGDRGPRPFATDISRAAMDNENFRAALWTGTRLQMTLMSIPPHGDVGMEVHPDTDQYIRVERGRASVVMGRSQNRPEFRQLLGRNDGVFVPAGMWHNIRNEGAQPLKLSSVYAPPHHPRGTVHSTKADAEKAHP